MGTSAGVVLAALLKATVVPRLKRYDSLARFESCACNRLSLRGPPHNRKWETLRCFIHTSFSTGWFLSVSSQPSLLFLLRFKCVFILNILSPCWTINLPCYIMRRYLHGDRRPFWSCWTGCLPAVVNSKALFIRCLYLPEGVNGAEETGALLDEYILMALVTRLSACCEQPNQCAVTVWNIVQHDLERNEHGGSCCFKTVKQMLKSRAVSVLVTNVSKQTQPGDRWRWRGAVLWKTSAVDSARRFSMAEVFNRGSTTGSAEFCRGSRIFYYLKTKCQPIFFPQI